MRRYTEGDLLRDYILRFGARAERPERGFATVRADDRWYAVLSNACGALAVYDDYGYVDPSRWPGEID